MSFSKGERIPLTGADCFLRTFDYEARRYHGASHLAQLVVRLGPGFDLARFEARLAHVLRIRPELRAAVRRPFLVDAPAYCVPSGPAPALPLEVRHEPECRDLPASIPPVFFERLNDRFAIERGDLLRFDIVRYGNDAATDLAMTWAHMLFDATGSEQFLASLAAETKEPCERAHAADGVKGVASSWRRFAQQAQVARQWGRRVIALGDPPPRSLAGGLKTTPQRLRYTLTTLTVDETQTVIERSARYVGFLTPTMFHLAAALRAHAAVFAQRNAEPECYLVPLPVRVQVNGDALAIGTHISLLWFRVLRQYTRELGTLVEELKRQRLEQIRNGAIEEGAMALEFFRLLPMPVYARLLRRNLYGEVASFLFAFTNQFAPGLQRFMGAPIVNAFHAPAVHPSPGSGLISSIHQGALNIAHVYQEGVLTDAERTVLHDRLLDDLLRS